MADSLWPSADQRIKGLEEKKLRMEVDKLNKEAERLKKKNVPKYDSSIQALIIDNVIIKTQDDSLENDLCKVLFATVESIEKQWSWDEIVEKWNESLDNFDPKKIYRAGNRLNKKVAEKTDIKELLIVSTKAIRVNPLLLK